MVMHIKPNFLDAQMVIVDEIQTLNINIKKVKECKKPNIKRQKDLLNMLLNIKKYLESSLNPTQKKLNIVERLPLLYLQIQKTGTYHD
jgi:nucleoside-triphosphatase THEP1